MADKKKRASWYEVHCDSHGRQPPDARMCKALRVSSGGTKKEKHGRVGCPECKKDSK